MMDRDKIRQAMFLLKRWDELNRCIHTLNEYKAPTAADPLGGGELPIEVFSFIDCEVAAKGLLSLAIEASGELRKKLTDLGVDLG